MNDLLIVEDDPALAAYLVAALGKMGYAVRQAGDRAGALVQFAGSEPPGLVLLDLGLPPQPSTMTEGLRLLDELLQIAPSTKIIVLTGQDENVAALEAVRRGAFDFLIKPVSRDVIQQALQRAALFAREENRMSQAGEARLSLTARFNEGPGEIAAAAEEQLVRRVLGETGWNIAETARHLGLSRENVYYYLKKYGIQRPQ
ncbi:MAG: two component transcriptional regulator, Fis family [Proteobacteria bacterium]|nr:two component transcriptional regulator, Fis family [Pseudomonadota bacterium]